MLRSNKTMSEKERRAAEYVEQKRRERLEKAKQREEKVRAMKLERVKPKTAFFKMSKSISTLDPKNKKKLPVVRQTLTSQKRIDIANLNLPEYDRIRELMRAQDLTLQSLNEDNQNQCNKNSTIGTVNNVNVSKKPVIKHSKRPEYSMNIEKPSTSSTVPIIQAETQTQGQDKPTIQIEPDHNHDSAVDNKRQSTNTRRLWGSPKLLSFLLDSANKKTPNSSNTGMDVPKFPLQTPEIFANHVSMNKDNKSTSIVANTKSAGLRRSISAIYRSSSRASPGQIQKCIRRSQSLRAIQTPRGTMRIIDEEERQIIRDHDSFVSTKFNDYDEDDGNFRMPDYRMENMNASKHSAAKTNSHSRSAMINMNSARKMMAANKKRIERTTASDTTDVNKSTTMMMMRGIDDHTNPAVVVGGTPKPAELQRRLMKWLQSRGKALSDFKNLHEFGTRTSATNHCPIVQQQQQQPRKNKENIPDNITVRNRNRQEEKKCLDRTYDEMIQENNYQIDSEVNKFTIKSEMILQTPKRLNETLDKLDASHNVITPSHHDDNNATVEVLSETFEIPETPQTKTSLDTIREIPSSSSSKHETNMTETEITRLSHSTPINNNIIDSSRNNTTSDNNSDTARGVLEDLKSLIVDGYPKEQCRLWLKTLKTRYSNSVLKSLPGYWECKALLQIDDMEDFESAVESCKRAKFKSTEEKLISALFENACKIEDGGDDKMAAAAGVAGNLKNQDGCGEKVCGNTDGQFASSVVKLAVRQRKKKTQTTSNNTEDLENETPNNPDESLFIATPVRRSSRLWCKKTPSNSNKLDCSTTVTIDFATPQPNQQHVQSSSTKKQQSNNPKAIVQYCNTLSELDPNVRKSIWFTPNEALMYYDDNSPF